MSSITTYESLQKPAQEKYQLGDITEMNPVDPSEHNIEPVLAPAGMYEVAVIDPYVEQYATADILEVKTAEIEADLFARVRRQSGSWQRKPGTAYYDAEGRLQEKSSWGDPESRTRFFGQLGSSAIDSWRELVPSASALRYLSDPNGISEVIGPDGSPTYIDETARKWLSLCTDAVGIRSRATVMAEMVRQFVEERHIGHGTEVPMRWMSVACGTALPAVKAAIHSGIAPELLLVDLDEKAMKSTAAIAEELGFKGPWESHRINIFNPAHMSKLAAELDANGGRPLFIDMMGIFEYTGDNLNVDPVSFLRSNYEMLAPGGRLVFGQMRSDRPVPDFTMGVVGWLYVEMRSPREVMEIIAAAGIPTEQAQLYLPQDNVYTVGVIDKPA